MRTKRVLLAAGAIWATAGSAYAQPPVPPPPAEGEEGPATEAPTPEVDRTPTTKAAQPQPGAASGPEAPPEPEAPKVAVQSGDDDTLKRLAELEARTEDLAERNVELEEELEILREDQEWTAERVDKILPLTAKVSGYIDMGFFYVEGDGRGIRSDTGFVFFPEFNGVVPDSWVFMGDPLSTAINSRGDPADVSESRAITSNPIDSNGNATAILNNINLQLFAGIGEHVTVNGMIDFIPRSRDASDPDGLTTGDFIDVRLGYLEYRAPTENIGITLSVGKFDSVLGFEYRSQEAVDRLTVTPSLICRYTCGHPIGIKSRLKFFDDALVLNVSATNGSHFTEGFPFSNETDDNDFKTGAGRLSYRFDVGSGLEIGASGAYGAQDFQAADDVPQWHAGADVRLEAAGLEITGEYVKGEAEGVSTPGEPRCGDAPCLEYQGAYGLFGYRVNNWLIPYARVDWRDALHTSGASFVYISELVRVTAGVRLEVDPAIIIKAEYTVNRELGRLPQFPNDIFTSSVTARF